MEGDAGSSRLNPPPMPMFRRLRRRRSKIHQEPAVAADRAGPEATADDSPESEERADQTSPAVTAEDTAASEAAASETEAEDATEADATEEATEDSEESEADADADFQRGRSRLGRGWLAGITAALVLCAGAIGAGGYFALRSHHESQAMARNDAAALKAATDCVSATQAPDSNAMVASEQKIIDCGTDAFRSQALLYTSMLVQAYQAANIRVQVSDVRAAVERHNSDGSVQVLVAMRVKSTTDQTQNETGYRLRVKMALAEGQYKISKLDQVTK
jgi:hypothetical protein